jgi:hypothetical protein
VRRVFPPIGAQASPDTLKAGSIPVARDEVAPEPHAADEGAEQISVRNQRARRGPEPGETGFAATDKELFPEIERLRKEGKARSISEATRVLAELGKISGSGSTESRATRVARRYGRHKSEAER